MYSYLASKLWVKKLSHNSSSVLFIVFLSPPLCLPPRQDNCCLPSLPSLFLSSLPFLLIYIVIGLFCRFNSAQNFNLVLFFCLEAIALLFNFSFCRYFKTVILGSFPKTYTSLAYYYLPLTASLFIESNSHAISLLLRHESIHSMGTY